MSFSAEYWAASIDTECDEAELKAWQALAGYKFQMFGYWAAIWVHLNRLRAVPKPNPFRDAVRVGRLELARRGLWPKLALRKKVRQ